MASHPRPRNFLMGIALLIVVVGLRYYHERDSQQAHVPASGHTTQSENGWFHHQGCILVEHPHNDGDSFRVRLPDGTQRDYRLYFVDAPEASFKRYADGNTNAKRIGEQARYFHNISPDQAVAIGQEAKMFTVAQLRNHPFDVITKNEAVYDSERHYAHIMIRNERLDELLVEKGLARIHTKGADLADGTTMEQHKVRLRELEATARQQKRGAWK